jgi:beta-glucuronidase
MEITLSGTWRGRADPGQAGMKSGWFEMEQSSRVADGWEAIQVPSCWNTIPKYERYEGIFWYAADFDLPPVQNPETAGEIEYTLKFNAVNYLCLVWVNGTEIGRHEGGYLPFELTVPGEIIRPVQNRIVVMADNFRSPQRIPGELFDWFNYGGIVRDVSLIARTPRHFKSIRIMTKINADGSAAVSVDYSQKQAFHFIWTAGADDESIISGIVESNAPDGKFDFTIQDAKHWSPDNPVLYKLDLIPSPDETAEAHSVRFGIREISISGIRIFLNGKPVKLKGVSLHEELTPYGRTIPREERFRDARDIKNLGFNALRTAHYSHDEALIDAADEIGLFVIEEIPVYWNIDFKNEAVYEKAEGMIKDLIARDFNHPSVIMWSVGNEVPVEDEACDLFIQRLMAEARARDSSRIVSYVSSRFLTDETRKASDVCCINCYLGWYFGDEKDLSGLLTAARESAPEKPWLLTEFGACAKHGFRSLGRRAKYSEDRQAEFLEHYIRTINSLDWISGWFIWIYRDFRSPMRTNKYQAGFNRKGIVSESREQKLIFEKIPALLNGKTRLKGTAKFKLFAPALKRLEEFLWRFAQPAAAKKSKSDYDAYFSGIRGKK